MRWDNVWIVPFYLADFVVLVAVLFCLFYFLKYRNSPLVKTSHSNVDNEILILLCLFCILPMFYFIETSPTKCLIRWLVQNIMFGMYCGLLFTKMPLFRSTRVSRKTACEQAHYINDQETPSLLAREKMYSALFVMLPVVITMATIPFSGNHGITESVGCSSRMGPCGIPRSSNAFASMAYTWSLLLSLSILALVENYRVQKCWKIPWVILVGFLSYTAQICFAYLKLQCSHDLWLNVVVYLLILINPVVCIITLYLPTLHLITSCSLHLKSFQKSSGSMRTASRHVYRDHSTGEVTLSSALFTGPYEETSAMLHAGLHAGSHTSTDLVSTRPASSASDANSRILNIQKSIQIVSNLFKQTEPRYKLLRQPSLYDNVHEPVIMWDNISQSSLATTLASDADSQSEASVEHAEITCEELKEMTEFLRRLRSSDA